VIVERQLEIIQECASSIREDLSAILADALVGNHEGFLGVKDSNL
jgi:hypothetical protein